MEALPMGPDRWHRVEQLYHSALKIPLEQRRAFLKDECQDDEELHEAVVSLSTYKDSTPRGRTAGARHTNLGCFGRSAYERRHSSRYQAFEYFREPARTG